MRIRPWKEYKLTLNATIKIQCLDNQRFHVGEICGGSGGSRLMEALFSRLALLGDLVRGSLGSDRLVLPGTLRRL